MSVLPQTAYEQFVQLVTEAATELRATAPSQGSEAWYVLQQLEQLAKNAGSSSSVKEVANSTKALGRLWIDLADDNTFYARRIAEIMRRHQNLLRAERRAANSEAKSRPR